MPAHGWKLSWPRQMFHMVTGLGGPGRLPLESLSGLASRSARLARQPGRPAHTGTAPISPWTLTFTFGGDQKIASLWNATYTQSGEQVTVTNEPYNSSVAPGASVTVGFSGSYSSSN